MRITLQTISNAPTVISPEGESVLQLRGLKIPYIENLGITRDMYAIIDLIDNQITELKNLPRLKNLRCLLLAKNSIVSIDSNFAESVPRLESLTLNENNITKFSALKGLNGCNNLRELTLMGNKVTSLPNYRNFISWLVPTLKVLDFQKIKDQERKRGLELYGINNGDNSKVEMFQESNEGNTTVPGNVYEEQKDVEDENENDEETEVGNGVKNLTKEERDILVKKLESAETMEEIEKIEALLRDD
ncbi:U2 small nuclear ribonucleoprotein A' [[Candida] anglica]|uniref:U2 small nuclear ribonucleoprotein A' n=1 Tax=[Candida] anglica TaxID=148631 RepID=A0ABP0EHZ9_9ASCO